MIRVGDLAPDFSATASTGSTVRRSDHRGRYVVLYFFPKAFTAGWTLEATRFRDAYAEIQGLGGDVIGVSVDPPDMLRDFAASLKVPFPMVSDADRRISKAYGVLWPLLRVDRRITVLIDPQGVAQGVFSHELQAGRHVDDALQMLRRVARPG